MNPSSLLESNEEARDHRRRRGEEIVRQNEPHPWGEGRKPDHHLIIAPVQRFNINTGLWACALPRAR
jgi:hypothetical protein